MDIYGIFAGVKLWLISWLFEYDVIKDTGFNDIDLTQDVALIEANVLLLQGHNLKLTFDTLISDQKNSDRWSIVYEYFPMAFTQIRAGFRYKNSDDDLIIDDSEESFVELHVFF